MSIMKKYSLIFLLILLATCANNSLRGTQINSDQTYTKYEFTNLEDFTNKAPGVGILVIKNKQTILKHGYGLANLETKQIISPDTVFETGSISKMFTAGAIIKLANLGKIDLSKPARDYLPPEFSFLPKNIKVNNLIFHTSGLPDYLNDKSLNLHQKVNSGELISNAFVMEYLKKGKINFKENNTKFSYSNTNYVLLSIIVSHITQTDYNTFLVKEIFEPNGMKSFINTPNRQLLSEESTSYSEWPHFQPLKNKINYITTGDFGIQMSLNDFEKWIHFMSSNQDYWQRYNTRGTEQNKGKTEQIDYGYGMRFGKIGGFECIFHRGFINGASNIFVYNKTLDTFVVILSNTSSVFTDNLAGYILKTINQTDSKNKQDSASKAVNIN